jgi:hypothetical protein
MASRDEPNAYLFSQPWHEREVVTSPLHNRQRAPMEGSAIASPTVEVSIGRIEVRATSGPVPNPAPRPTPAPNLSLDDYLRRRRGDQA